jgi:putative hydrolase of HD superfamily
MSESRINTQIAFLSEIDKLKSIKRATTLANKSRRENSAEHSWHVTLFALIFSEHANQNVDLFRAIKMLLIHDIVEIDAGDTPIFGNYDYKQVQENEKKAASRIFGLLPIDQRLEMLEIWLEFEESKTPTAQFAKSMDRFQAPNQNLISGGGTWIEYKVKFNQVEKRVGSKISIGAPKLWNWLKPRLKAFLDS